MKTKRADIQIYRAIAVIAVILYHTNQTKFKYLYLGVDIFFVVSGYLMTILYLNTRYKIFIRKRLQRLIPSYIVVTFIFWVIITLQTFPFELKRIYNSLFSSHVGLSNYYFISQQSYFDSSSYQPLLHLWSLSIEVQFYLLAPMLFLLYKRYGIRSAIITAVCSFAIYLFVHNLVSEKIAFFSIVTRIWEFALGAIAGLIFTKYRPSFRPWQSILLAISFVALLTISSLITIPQKSEVLRVIVCLAVSFLLIQERRIPSENRIAVPLIFVGNISYELYLVHFPLKAVMSYEPLTSNRSQVLDSLLAVSTYLILTFLISFIVFKLVRRIDNLNWMKSFSILIAITVTVSSLIVVKPQLFYTSKEIKLSQSLEDYDRRRCDWSGRISNLTSLSCPVLQVEESEGKILLVGDSFANSIKPLVKTFALSQRHDLFINADNSRFIGNSFETTFINAKELEVEMLIFHSSQNVSRFELERIKFLQDSNQIPKVVIIQTTPIFNFSVGKQAVSELEGKSNPIRVHPRDLENYLDLSEPLMEGIGNLRYIKILPYLCPTYCVYSDKTGAALYFDRSHITNSGLKLLNPILNQLQEFIKSTDGQRKT
jgi:peptidoglycan/LPS O-acetylase OafA/YrhL